MNKTRSMTATVTTGGTVSIGKKAELAKAEAAKKPEKGTK